MEKSSKSIRQTLFSYWNIYGPFPNSNTVHIHILASDIHSCRRLISDRITLMRPKLLFLTTCNRSFRHTRNTNTNIELSSFRQIYGLCPPSHRKVCLHNSTSTVVPVISPLWFTHAIIVPIWRYFFFILDFLILFSSFRVSTLDPSNKSFFFFYQGHRLLSSDLLDTTF